MREVPATTDRAAELSRDEIFALAARALSVLAEKAPRAETSTVEARVRDLCAAMLHASDERTLMAVSRLIASGVSSDEIVDIYIPRAAVRLGEGWLSDTLSFADVTIAAARLQETVRSVCDGGTRRGVTIPLGRRVLLVIPRDEDHTLGAFVAATQMRRYGLWVHMAIGEEPDEIADTVRSMPFDMVGLSGSGRKALAPVARIVEKIRVTVASPPPLVLGGNICNLDLDLPELVGVDLATTSPRKAMDFCGIMLGGKGLQECAVL